MLAGATFPNTGPGHRRALSWIRRHSPAMNVLAAVEGTSSYGAGITAALRAAGIEVTEARPVGRHRDRAGKSDVIDAELAARSVLGVERQRIPVPRQSSEREDLRILLAARRILDQQRTANRNALTALLRTVDLGIDARKPLHDNQIRAIAAWRINQKLAATNTHAVARQEARRLARAVLEHTTQLQDNHQQLRALAAHAAPGSKSSPVLDQSPQPSSSAPTPTADASALRLPSPPWAAWHHFPPHQATPPDTACPAPGTANSTARSTSSSAAE